MKNGKDRLASGLIVAVVALIIAMSGGLVTAWTQIVQNSTSIDAYQRDIGLLRADIRRLSDKVDRLVEAR